jgi:hypothetical protein
MKALKEREIDPKILEDVNNLERNKTVILECQNLEKK